MYPHIGLCFHYPNAESTTGPLFLPLMQAHTYQPQPILFGNESILVVSDRLPSSTTPNPSNDNICLTSLTYGNQQLKFDLSLLVCTFRIFGVIEFIWTHRAPFFIELALYSFCTQPEQENSFIRVYSFQMCVHSSFQSIAWVKILSNPKRGSRIRVTHLPSFCSLLLNIRRMRTMVAPDERDHDVEDHQRV